MHLIIHVIHKISIDIIKIAGALHATPLHKSCTDFIIAINIPDSAGSLNPG
jgi:hypothetical protein